MEIFWSKKLKVPFEKEFVEFCQMMANRILQGNARYGNPDPSKEFIKRAEKELTAYTVTGNKEYLINAANYCWLESVAPLHPNFHHDDSVRSVTRKRREE